MSAAGPIAGYEDWPGFLRSASVLQPAGDDRAELARVLEVREASASEVEIVRGWTNDGVQGLELRWRMPFGPPTRAFLLQPESCDHELPGVLAMHCHGGVRSTGAEQLVDTSLPPHESAARLRANVYEGGFVANDLAREGFVVLAHDTFSWGSRAFDFRNPTPRLAHAFAAQEALWRETGVVPTAMERFDAISGLHEDSLAKAAGAIGTTLAGAVVTDDLVALGILAGWPGVDANRLGTIGLSGGGGRAALVGALDARVRAVVITCMMATSASIVPAQLDTHSWLLNSPGIHQFRDWPDVTRVGGPRWTLVQYGEQDALFSSEGMHDADAHLAAEDATSQYRGRFYETGHVSTLEMQSDALRFLRQTLP